jgi:hypothetical protein
MQLALGWVGMEWPVDPGRHLCNLQLCAVLETGNHQKTAEPVCATAMWLQEALCVVGGEEEGGIPESLGPSASLPSVPSLWTRPSNIATMYSPSSSSSRLR